jgi:arylsulfatase A-like enzyme
LVGNALLAVRNLLLGGIAAAAFSHPAGGQVMTGTPGAPSATFTPNSAVLPPPPLPFKGTITTSAANSKEYWPAQLVAPMGAPNVLLIITDDVGYGAPSTFGGVIPTPGLERVAKAGLRFTQFHTTALCSPTRAALITGRNHHEVGAGVITEVSTGFPGYNAVIPRDSATIGEVLKQNGYVTAWFGKDHNVPPWEASPNGPFENWPSGQGFDYFYGFVGGDTSQWQPGNLFRNTTRIQPYLGHPGWNLTTAVADDAIGYIRQQHESAPNRPWFVKYAPSGTHAPHHAPPEWIARFKGRFDGGWEKLREDIFANQKRLGVLPPHAKLSAWPKELPRWDTLSADQKRLYARQMEVFAGYLAYTDSEINRVIQQVDDQGQRDNTLIIYISGDNGGSSEGQLNGTPNEVAYFNGVTTPVEQQLKLMDQWGSDKTYNHMAAAWSLATNTPYRWMKQVASHFGGTRNGVAMSWPARIKDQGGIRQQFHHVVDIYPTILEAIGIPVPTEVNGARQRRLDGVSMAYLFDKANANTPSRRETQYFEMFGGRGIYHKGWFANTAVVAPPWDSMAKKPPVEDYPWELYNIVDDPSQTNDLAATKPAKLKEMQALFDQEARANQVYPLSNQLLERLLLERPGPAAGRKEFVYCGVGIGLTADAAPSLLNRAYTVTSEFEVPQGGAKGVLATQGGRFAGWGLYLIDSKPVFTWNLLDINRIRWTSPDALPPGKHKVEFSFIPDASGPPVGRGGIGRLSVDGQLVSEQRMAQTIPFYLQWDEPFDIGQDTGTPVADADYQLPFDFTGKLDNVTFRLGDSTLLQAPPALASTGGR